MGWGGVVGRKWRQLYLNNNKKSNRILGTKNNYNCQTKKIIIIKGLGNKVQDRLKIEKKEKTKEGRNF